VCKFPVERKSRSLSSACPYHGRLRESRRSQSIADRECSRRSHTSSDMVPVPGISFCSSLRRCGQRLFDFLTTSSPRRTLLHLTSTSRLTATTLRRELEPPIPHHLYDAHPERSLPPHPGQPLLQHGSQRPPASALSRQTLKEATHHSPSSSARFYVSTSGLFPLFTSISRLSDADL